MLPGQGRQDTVLQLDHGEALLKQDLHPEEYRVLPRWQLLRRRKLLR